MADEAVVRVSPKVWEIVERCPHCDGTPAYGVRTDFGVLAKCSGCGRRWLSEVER